MSLGSGQANSRLIINIETSHVYLSLRVFRSRTFAKDSHPNGLLEPSKNDTQVSQIIDLYCYHGCRIIPGY